jgi:hypothetical protein
MTDKFTIKNKHNGQNHAMWKADMEEMLILNGLWVAIAPEAYGSSGSSSRGDPETELKARAALTKNMNETVKAVAKSFKTASEMWEGINAHYNPKTPQNRLYLTAMLESIKLKSDENPDTYTARIMSVADQLAAVDRPQTDEDLAMRMLLGLPPDDPDWNTLFQAFMMRPDSDMCECAYG